METLSDFGTVSYFGVSTFTTEIYNSWFIFDDLNTSNFLSLLLLIFVLFFFIVENYLRKDSRFHSLKNEGKRKKQDLKGIASFLATGLDPNKSILFNQSSVSGHAELAWILNCVSRIGWLNRMTQFKEKAGSEKEKAS